MCLMKVYCVDDDGLMIPTTLIIIIRWTLTLPSHSDTHMDCRYRIALWETAGGGQSKVNRTIIIPFMLSGTFKIFWQTHKTAADCSCFLIIKFWVRKEGEILLLNPLCHSSRHETSFEFPRILSWLEEERSVFTVHCQHMTANVGHYQQQKTLIQV